MEQRVMCVSHLSFEYLLLEKKLDIWRQTSSFDKKCTRCKPVNFVHTHTYLFLCHPMPENGREKFYPSFFPFSSPGANPICIFFLDRSNHFSFLFFSYIQYFLALYSWHFYVCGDFFFLKCLGDESTGILFKNKDLCKNVWLRYILRLLL